MKKIIFTLFLATAAVSCKKENQVSEITTVETDSISEIEPQPEAKALPMTTPENASDFLAKKNDTLYVTNFFATWCGPCVKEIPHFKGKIEELKDQPVKITFVSLDQKNLWNSEVPRFAQEQGIQDHTVLLDGSLLDAAFFKNNFAHWDGGAIPFTFMRRGDKTDEVLGMISEATLTAKINALLK